MYQNSILEWEKRNMFVYFNWNAELHIAFMFANGRGDHVYGKTDLLIVSFLSLQNDSFKLNKSWALMSYPLYNAIFY